MLKILKRAVNPKDLRAATKGRKSLTSNLLLGALPVSTVLFGAVYFVTRSLLFAGSLSGALLLASAVSNVGFFRNIARRRDSDSDEVEVIEVRAEGVTEVEHHGSHGPAWVFFAGGDSALLLVGQWLLEQRSFPSLEFEVMLWSDTKEPIRIMSRSPRVEPTQSNVKLPSSSKIKDVEMIRASVSTLQADLYSAFPE